MRLKSPAQDTPADAQIILEVLEERIAPAALATFQDVDGDTVHVTSSKGTSAHLQTIVNTALGAGHQLKDLILTNEFAKTNLTIKVVTLGATGDGLVNVGEIDAHGLDLGAVVVGGDIGKILAGDAVDKTMGLKSLTAQSIGKYGNVTQGNTGNIDWLIEGGTAKFTVANSVDGALLKWNSTDALKVGMISIGADLTGAGSVQAGDGSIQLVSATHTAILGMLKVGGSLIGDTTGTYAKTGYVSADQIGSVTIGGSLVGTGAANTGKLDVSTVTLSKPNIGTITIGGSLEGGGGTASGSIAAFSLGNVSIAGDLLEGSGSGAGEISAPIAKNLTVGGSINGGHISVTQVANITIHGDVVGGTTGLTGDIRANSVSGKLFIGGSLKGNATGLDAHDDTGFIQVGTAKQIEIGGDIDGGNNSTNVAIHEAGSIQVLTSLASLIVHGSILAGKANNAADLDLGAVRGQVIGSIQVDGSITGNTAGNFVEDVMITGAGTPGVKTGTNIAIGNLAVNGNVTHAQILGGYGPGTTAINGAGIANNGGSAQMGTIIIKGDFLDSSIATGVNNHGFAWADGGSHNTLIPKITGGTIVASIAKIVIGGATNGTTNQGIIAEQIESLSLGELPVTLGPSFDHKAISFNNKLQLETFIAP